MKESKLEHIEYLIHAKEGAEGSGLASRLSVSLADLSLGSLHSKWYSEPFVPLVNVLRSMGMKLTDEDIKIVIRESKDLKFLTSLVAMLTDLTDSDLCEQCLSSRNMPFASHFLSRGAKPNLEKVIDNLTIPCPKSLPSDIHDSFLSYLDGYPEWHHKIASKAISCDCLDTFQRFSQSLDKESSSTLCEQALTQRKKKFVDFLIQKCGANPNPKSLIDALPWYECDREEVIHDYLVQNPTSHQDIASRAIKGNNLQFFRKFGSQLDKLLVTDYCNQALAVGRKEIANHLIQHCEAHPEAEVVVDALGYRLDCDEILVEYLVQNPASHQKVAERAIKKSKVKLLRKFASLLDEEKCTELCNQALKNEKIEIANHLIENCGAQPEPKAVVDVLEWHDPDKRLVDYLIRCPSIHCEVVSQCITANNFKVFHEFSSKLDQVSSTELCEQALGLRRRSIALHLISNCGASPQARNVMRVIDWRMPNEIVLDYLASSDADTHKEVASLAIKRGDFFTLRKFASLLGKEMCTCLCNQALAKHELTIAKHLMKSCGANPEPQAVVDSLQWHNETFEDVFFGRRGSRVTKGLDKDLIDYLIGCPSAHQQVASQAILNNNFQVFQEFVSHLTQESCAVVCEKALAGKRSKFVCHFIQHCGINPDPEMVISILQWHNPDACLVDYLIACPSAHQKVASQAILNNSLKVFQRFAPLLSKDACTSLCEQAITDGRLRFVGQLISKYEATPHPECVMEAIDWTGNEDDYLIDYLALSCTHYKSIASRALRAGNVKIFQKFALSLKSESNVIAQLCDEAASEQKLSFLKFLIAECNAKPGPKTVDVLDWKNIDEEMLSYLISESYGIQLLVRAIQHNSYDVATRCAKPLTPDERNGSLVDLSALLQTTNLASHPDIFDKLLEVGADPNRRSSENELRPLDVAFTLGNVQIITSLVMHGADCSLCSPATTRDTTIIHMVTELAFESGKKKQYVR